VLRDFFSQLKQTYNLVGVEVGVKLGDNAKTILEELDIKKLILVDQWKAYDISTLSEEQKRMRYYDQRILDRWKRVVDKRFKDDKRVQIIHASSMNAAMKMFDSVLHFAYLDAGHRYDDVLQDCNTWYRCVKDGWFLAGHDYLHNDFGSEIQKAVSEFAKSINKPVNSSGGDWWIQK
jgi:hypothetical protein